MNVYFANADIHLTTNVTAYRGQDPDQGLVDEHGWT